MRSHAQIITDAGGPHAVARLVLPHVQATEVTLQKRVRAWAVTGSIPGDYWPLLQRLGTASMDELGHDAAFRKGIAIPAANDDVASERAA